MEIKLTKQDWEEAKQAATDNLKQALKLQVINKALLEIAEREIKKEEIEQKHHAK